MDEIDAARKRILFLDDERRVLDGLQRMLHPFRHVWHMEFVGAATEALERLAADEFDVIVTDVRMPGMDGMTLLGVLQERHPRIVRIVLTGHTEMEAALRALPVAHQFLSKPCRPAALRKVIERACALNDLLASEPVRRVVGGIRTLPTLPAVYRRLLEVLGRGDSSAADVAAVVETDMALSARVLQLVNSPYVGAAHRIGSIKHAVAYLGMNTIKNLTLSSEVYRWMDEVRCPEGFDPQRIQYCAFVCARVAARILGDTPQAEEAVTASTVLDIGQLVLATRLPGEFATILAQARSSGRPTHVVEREVLGATHAEIGAYLIGLWGLPYPVVEAVAHHHDPHRVSHQELDVLGAVALATQLTAECLDEDGAADGGLGRDYLHALGVLDQLEELRAVTRLEAECMKT